MSIRLLFAGLLGLAAPLPAQIARVPLESSGVYSSGPARAAAIIADEGRHAALRGVETGTFSLWTTTTVLRDVRLSFETSRPHVLIAGSSIAKSIVARPEGTTVVYSHPSFTVRQHIFVPLDEAAAMMLLQVDAVQPLDIIIHTPAGERRIAVDSLRAAREYFQVIISAADTPFTASVLAYWQEKAGHFRRVRTEGISLATPDTRLNQAFEWAKANLDQRFTRFTQVDVLQAFGAQLLLNAFEHWTVYGSGMPRPPDDDSLANTVLRIVSDSVSRQIARAAFGLLDSDSAQELLADVSATDYTSDWGVRERRNGAVSSFVSGLAALAHYRQHRSWAGIDLLRDMARSTFDFTRGRPPHVLSGAYYQTMPALAPRFAYETPLFAAAVVRGLLGWETDPQHRAANLEPHMPADLSSMAFSGLRLGRDRIDVELSRENGVYTVGIHRVTEGAPLLLRVAPALPLGASIDRIVVNDEDAPVQSEDTPHDVHAVVEVRVLQDVQVEVHYHGGIDVAATVEQVDVGEASHELRILDYTREGPDYVVTLEGVPASVYTLRLRAEQRVQRVTGADSFEQKQEHVTIRATMPPGTGHVRKTLRIKA